MKTNACPPLTNTGNVFDKPTKYINLPLSVEAMSCLNKKDDPNDLIYTFPAGTSNIERNIKKWLEAAGIEMLQC